MVAKAPMLMMMMCRMKVASGMSRSPTGGGEGNVLDWRFSCRDER